MQQIKGGYFAQYNYDSHETGTIHETERIEYFPKSQHSERLALCQFRLFTIRLGDDQELNNQAASSLSHMLNDWMKWINWMP
jgi:hypothetical protein